MLFRSHNLLRWPCRSITSVWPRGHRIDQPSQVVRSDIHPDVCRSASVHLQLASHSVVSAIKWIDQSTAHSLWVNSCSISHLRSDPNAFPVRRSFALVSGVGCAAREHLSCIVRRVFQLILTFDEQVDLKRPRRDVPRGTTEVTTSITLKSFCLKSALRPYFITGLGLTDI